MKSIIEEASSIEKAVEKGWIRAGKPQEFLVKVLEEPEKKLFGLFTKKSAKVSLFFQERAPQPERGRRPQQQDKRRTGTATQPTRQGSYDREKSQGAPQQRTRPQQQPYAQQSQPQQQQQQPQGPKQDPWTPEMLKASKEWMEKSLAIMGKNIPFTVDAKNYYLTIAFAKPLLDDPEKTKTIFRSFAYLLMQTMRNQFKKSFKGHKIIIRGIGTEEDVRNS